MAIHRYDDPEHRRGVCALWKRVFNYRTPHNEPGLSIDAKLAVEDGLFFVLMEGNDVVGSVMAGFDGHRGWIYALCIDPTRHGRGHGSALLGHAEAALIERGCMKINLQVMPGNERAVEFYARHGYAIEPRTSMGRIVPENIPDRR